MNDLEDRIQRMDVKPGDVLVFSAKETLSNQQVVRIKEEIHGAFERLGKKPPLVVVLDRGATLSLLSAEALEAKLKE
jgi:hypothetical protein